MCETSFCNGNEIFLLPQSQDFKFTNAQKFIGFIDQISTFLIPAILLIKLSKGIHIGFDTVQNAGIIQAGDFGVSYRNLSLNPNYPHRLNKLYHWFRVAINNNPRNHLY